MGNDNPFQFILVPAGAEYQVVHRALRHWPEYPRIVPIPAGPQAVQAFLATWEERQSLQAASILLLGLGGSLSPHHGVGDGVLLQKVWDESKGQEAEGDEADATLTQWIAQRLPSVTMGTGVMSDRVVTSAAAKRQLRDQYGADVVDMESAALLKALPQCQIAILRVISDDWEHDLPDISTAISPAGAIKAVPLALSCLRQPIAALRLIRGAIKGLKALGRMTAVLFQSGPIKC